MKQFEYEVTKHTNDEFSHLVYFCSGEGQCNLDQVPSDQTKVMTEILNEKGSAGWELIQSFFGSDGLVMIWKREL